MKSTELTDFRYPLMPKCPEDAELASPGGYLPLNLSFPEMMNTHTDIMEHATAEELTPLLADTD